MVALPTAPKANPAPLAKDEATKRKEVVELETRMHQDQHDLISGGRKTPLELDGPTDGVKATKTRKVQHATLVLVGTITLER